MTSLLRWKVHSTCSMSTGGGLTTIKQPIPLPQARYLPVVGIPLDGSRFQASWHVCPLWECRGIRIERQDGTVVIRGGYVCPSCRGNEDSIVANTFSTIQRVAEMALHPTSRRLEESVSGHATERAGTAGLQTALARIGLMFFTPSELQLRLLDRATLHLRTYLCSCTALWHSIFVMLFLI